MSDRLKIGQEVLIHGYVDEIRKDTVIIRNDGGYFGTVEYEVTDKMPNMNEVLDKIRAEIRELKHFPANSEDKLFYNAGLLDAIEIIAKYKNEVSE